MYHYDGIKHYLFALGMDENIRNRRKVAFIQA